MNIIQRHMGQNAVLLHPFDRRISLLRKVFTRPNLGRMILEWQFLEVNEFQFGNKTKKISSPTFKLENFQILTQKFAKPNL